MKRLYFSRLIFVLLLGLPGCAGRIIDWAKETVPQGMNLPSHESIPRYYLRSVGIYDQFDTQAIFDALWLSDEVRTAYAQSYVQKYGKTEEQYAVFLRRQLAENEYFIMFYVLSLYDVPLRDKGGPWGIFLEIDGIPFAPSEIKAVDITPEYQAFFGKRLSPFKVSYVVKFNAKDIENKPLLNPCTKELALVFRSMDKEGRLSWVLAPEGIVSCGVE